MKILIAESDAEFSRFLSSYFSRKNHSTECVFTEKDATAKLLTFNPDVVISAVDLEDGSGYNLCNAVKSDPRTSQTVFALIFPEVSQWPAERTRQIIKKANLSLRKPFKPEQLEEAIMKQLSSAAVQEKPQAPLLEWALGSITPGEPDEPGAEALGEAEGAAEIELLPPPPPAEAAAEDEDLRRLDDAFEAIQLRDAEIDLSKELSGRVKALNEELAKRDRDILGLTTKLESSSVELRRMVRAKELEIADLKAKLSTSSAQAAEQPAERSAQPEIAKLRAQLEAFRQDEEKLKAEKAALQKEFEEKFAQSEARRIEEMRALREGVSSRQQEMNTKILAELGVLKERDAARQKVNERVIKALQLAISLLESKG